MSEDGSAAVRQSMIQSDNAEKAQESGGNKLNLLHIANFAFDWLANAHGNMLEAFQSPLTKLQNLLPSVEFKNLIGVSSLIDKLKEAMSTIHGPGMPHQGGGYVGGSPMHDELSSAGSTLSNNGVSYGGDVSGGLSGGFSPDNLVGRSEDQHHDR